MRQSRQAVPARWVGGHAVGIRRRLLRLLSSTGECVIARADGWNRCSRLVRRAISRRQVGDLLSDLLGRDRRDRLSTRCDGQAETDNSVNRLERTATAQGAVGCAALLSHCC